MLGATALVTLGAISTLVRFDPLGLTIDVDPASEPLINPHDPGIPIYRQAVRDFGNDDLYVVVMETDGIFTRENLEVLHRLTHRLRRLPGVASVQSLARVLSIRHDSVRDLVRVDDFIDRVPEDPEAIARLEHRALADPLYRKTLISADGRAAAINLRFRPMTDAEFVELDLDGKIAALLETERDGGRRFYVAGRPHVRAQAYHIMVGDLARLIPIAVAVA
ncbi:MAG: MMPL family transporter, partial [Phycisphaeraceae bacterium]|nr:MMPL family transporter [Phycisphaeraceae bacterium]